MLYLGVRSWQVKRVGLQQAAEGMGFLYAVVVVGILIAESDPVFPGTVLFLAAGALTLFLIFGIAIEINIALPDPPGRSLGRSFQQLCYRARNK